MASWEVLGSPRGASVDRAKGRLCDSRPVAAKSKSTLDAAPQRGGETRARPVLRVLYGPAGLAPADAAFPLGVGHHPLGREGEGIVLDDPRVSRTHATVHVASRSFKTRIADEDSRHGTWVNGDRVDERWLDDGDVIRLGDTFLIVRFQSGDEEDAPAPGLLGISPAIARLRHAVALVAPHDVTVMIRGPSGTGKEVVARAIHEGSGRGGAFVAVNCAAIPEHLAESQLFGHVAGAFTGARGDHVGFFRAAEGGTVLLDEIGDMPLELQPKLLRALESRSVIPVGGTTPLPFDARILVATHRDLEALIEEGGFRGDLYARLAHFQLDVPPLSVRREDVLPLLVHAIGAASVLDPELIAALLRHRWPYNVRELLAVASELKVRGAGCEVLELELVRHRLGLDAASTPATSASHGSEDDRERAAPPTREEMERIVAEHRGNVRAISRATGRSRMQVYRWVEQYGIDLAAFRD